MTSGVKTDLIYLIACALRGETADADRVGQMELSALDQLSSAQGLSAMTACALLDSGAPEQEKWKQLRDRALRRAMLMDAERTELLNLLEKEEIWHAPLKGVITAALYPAYGMRQMSDNDILIDPGKREAVAELMLARGYERKEYEMLHDSYYKKPIFNFEMHFLTVDGAMLNDRIRQYYADKKDLLKPVENKRYQRQMSREDHFIYTVAHACKHLINAGTGLRTAVDHAVMLQAWKDLDQAYLKAEFEKLELSDLVGTLDGLARKLFLAQDAPDVQALCEDEREMLQVMLEGGVYGTRKRVYRNRFKNSGRRSRVAYLWMRLFPEKEWMIRRNPVLKERPYLLGAMYVKRLFRGVFLRRKEAMREVNTVWEMKKDP